MRLKKLELIGFKSFADKTQIFFDKGVTCVVGPNGCGKSNISDSIRWVLGERSAKLLRGNKMEDVIFNGTDFRKPVSYAEVSLTFDNEDRGLPIDYHEVTITRRLHRTGESEYLINKTLVRLKDVQDLILDTGIGSNSYSMIEQGRIDYVLRADPEERRFLIEEAAGISKYKVKKEEALRKLERTEENILRLNDIVQEVHKNIQYAERQAKRAEKYKVQYERLKDLEIRKAFYDIRVLSGDKEAVQRLRDETQRELDRLESDKASKKELLRTQQEQLHQTLNHFSSEEAKRYGLISRKEKDEQQLRFHQEKRVEYAMRRGEIQQELTQLAERIQKTEKEIEIKKQELEKIAQESGRIEGDLKIAEESLSDAETKLSEAKSMLQKSKMEAFEIAGEMTRVRNEYHRLMAFIESSDRQKNKMSGSLSRFNNEQQDWEDKKRQYAERLSDLRQQEESFSIQYSRVKEEKENLIQQLERETEEKAQCERTLHEKSTRLNMLRELDAASGWDKAKLAETLPEIQQNLLHSIRDIVHVQEGYEWALEAALGSFSQALVSENIEEAEKLYRHLTESKTSGFSLWVRRPIPDIASSDNPLLNDLIECSLSSVVQIQSGYENLLTPYISNVYVIRPFEQGQLAPLLDLAEQYRLVTREGVFIGPHGRIYFRQGFNLDQSFFKRGHEMEHVEVEMRELEESVTRRTSELAEIETRIDRLNTEQEMLHKSQIDCKIQIESVESLRNGLEDRLVSHHRETQLVMQEIMELQTQQTEVTVQKENLERRLAELTEKEKSHLDYENGLLREIDDKDRSKNNVLKEVAERKARFDHIRDQQTLLNESLQIFTSNQTQDHERTRNLQEEFERIGQKEKGLEDEDIRIQSELSELDISIRESDVSLEMIRQDKSRFETEIAAVETIVQEITDQQNQIQETLHQSEIKAMDLGYQEKAISERMEQAYHLRLSEIDSNAYPWEDRDMDAVNTEIGTLREKVETMGTVNLLAIDEYEELKQRYDFMTGQKQDLENAREELLEAIRKINRTTKSLFEETFNNVQQTFKEYYQVLFRGGEARLVLVDETHPLESGIDIVVRPPGKRLQHISLLSGGEKALTAIALLFALFKIKPSPYCVLDEVDAPLDEANVDRFLTVLRTFLETSQFIIITHNRKTISMGDSLYGVTMEEAGVSKIVSVKVNTDEQDEPVEESETSDNTIEDSDSVEDSVTA